MKRIGFVLYMIPTIIGLVVLGLVIGLIFLALTIYTPLNEEFSDYWKTNKNPWGMVKDTYKSWF